MNSKDLKPSWRGREVISGVLVTMIFVLSGCASNSLELEAESTKVIRQTSMSPMDYYQILSRMTPAELGRERMVLSALPNSPNTQIRMAMLFGHPRAPQDISRALALLDSVLKSIDPAAIALQPLARLLADNYAERQKIDAHLDRQTLLLKESQRKAAELQEKIDALADIERTLPQRPRAARQPAAGKVR
jgi:hypothetical protein